MSVRSPFAIFGIALVLEIAVMFAVAFHSRSGAINLLWFSIPPVAMGLVGFREWPAKLAAAGGMWLMIWPTGVLAEGLAHLMGTCLQ